MNKKKKKILFIGDDIRFFSGVACQLRELIFGTLSKYDYCCIAGASKHPEAGKVVDMSAAVAKEVGIADVQLHLYPVDGYGNEDILMNIINIEKPDAICMITDPRYYGWLFMSERMIRNKIPIVYWNIWDDLPYPMWNRSGYMSCDALLGISKQTYNINKWVVRPENCITIDGELDGNGKLIKK